jgi:hypothetical protein
MAGIHFNIKTGRRGRCTAQPGKCPVCDEQHHFATEEDVNKYEDGLRCPIKPTLESVQNEDINIIVGSLDNYQLAFDKAEEKKEQIASYEKDIKDTYYQYMNEIDNLVDSYDSEQTKAIIDKYSKQTVVPFKSTGYEVSKDVDSEASYIFSFSKAFSKDNKTGLYQNLTKADEDGDRYAHLVSDEDFKQSEEYFRLRGLDDSDIEELHRRLDKIRESRENIEKCNSELVAVGKQCSGIYKYFNNRGSDKTLLDGVPAEKKSKIIKSIDEYNSILAKAGEKYSRYDDFKQDVPAPEGWDKDYEDECRKAKDNLDNMKEAISRSGRRITR